VSSTFIDLQQYRQAVALCIRRMGFDDIAMEYFVAEDSRPLAACLQAVRCCDLYVGLFAWRYGFVPESDNPDHRSITEMEYREALARGKDCIILLVDPGTPGFLHCSTRTSSPSNGFGRNSLRGMSVGFSSHHKILAAC
jgi:hypothetical protein